MALGRMMALTDEMSVMITNEISLRATKTGGEMTVGMEMADVELRATKTHREMADVEVHVTKTHGEMADVKLRATKTHHREMADVVLRATKTHGRWST